MQKKEQSQDSILQQSDEEHEKVKVSKNLKKKIVNTWEKFPNLQRANGRGGTNLVSQERHLNNTSEPPPPSSNQPNMTKATRPTKYFE